MTLQEIREKKFPRAFKGYSDSEVDAFMAQIASAYEKLEEELERNGGQMDVLQARLAEYEGMDREIRGALLAAQKAAREIVEEARNKEKAILEESQVSLEKIREEIENQQGQADLLKRQALDEVEEMRAQAQAEIEEQKSLAQEFVDSMKKRVQEETDFMKGLAREEVNTLKNLAQEEHEEKTRVLQEAFEREKEALDREIEELVSVRGQVRGEVESMLRDNIEVLSERLQLLPEPYDSEPESNDEAPETEALQEEVPQEDENRQEEPGEQASRTAGYSPADIPGADATDELPKLDFQG